MKSYVHESKTGLLMKTGATDDLSLGREVALFQVLAG